MKRTIFLKISSYFLLISYISLISVDLVLGTISISKFWFSSLLVIIGLIFFIRFCCYKIDSCLFLSMWSMLSGICGILNFFYNFSLPFVFGIYIGSFALASFSIFIKFRQIFHLKVFVFGSLCGILLVLFSEKLINVIAFWVLISLTLLTIIILIVSSIKINTRKVWILVSKKMVLMKTKLINT